MTGKKMTLGELFARMEREVKERLAAEDAYRQTPEGKAEHEAREAHHKRMDEADQRAWEARPPRQKGYDAQQAGEDREVPEGLTEAESEAWLAGWDEGEQDEIDAEDKEIDD
jgi:ribosome modulation factor